MKTIHLFITLFFLLIMNDCSHSSREAFIAVNQTGYEMEAPKKGFAVNTEAGFFQIIRTADARVVFSGRTEPAGEADSITGDTISIIDFSEFSDPGEYKIKTMGPGEITSHNFRIKKDIYRDALLTILESYYYHRCGTEVSNGTEWGYQSCHLDDAPFYDQPEKSKKVTGGWHDAGDYNKFSVNTALSAGLLLYTYQTNPEIFKDNQLNIPESGNGIPDLLDEISWALEWLLRMQRDDGAVYHKVSQEKWIGEYLPNEDPSTRYIFKPSSAATALFAAASALGSHHLAEYNPSLSRELSEAAIKAWKYLEAHPENQPAGGFKNPPGVSGGEYGDPFDLDERLWASVELFNLTKNELYLKFFVRNYRQLTLNRIPPVSWRDANSLALNAFLFTDTNDAFSDDKKAIQTALLNHADSLLEIQKQNNYLNLLRKSEYYWGSNSVGLAYAFDLIQAYKITGNKEYSLAALDQLHYIFGRNPFNLSQVTGVGSVSVKHPYHQLSEMGNFSTPVPGMLVGGPNNHLLLNNVKISPYPGKNYEDRFRNYLVNEPAINYTAILAYVVGAFSLSDNQPTILTEVNKS